MPIKGQFPKNISLSLLNGANGFELDGVSASDLSGAAVASLDINGDGISDLVIGASNAASGAGKTYVVFGKRSAWFSPFSLSTLNGTNGFELDGASANDGSGCAVASTDINGDGILDLVIGASRAASYAGKTYVVFGKRSAWSSPFSLSTLNGTNGFELDGVSANDYSGCAVASTDINGDGISDLVIGAYRAASAAGKTYVVFGKTTPWSNPISLATLNGANGFELDGVSVGDESGYAVGSTDINGDGILDLVIGAFGAASSAGKTYAVFGKTSA